MFPETTNPERERRRNEILAACLDDPTLAAELREFLADQSRFAAMLGVPAPPLPSEEATRPYGSRLADDAPRPPLNTFGDYELLEEVARGGMGVVYKARQKGLNRVVALKMILDGRWASEAERRRFRAEAESAARLRHPNIVTVHEVGEVDGRPFFSMEYIEGRTLSRRLDGGPIPGRVAAGYALLLAEAIAFAHSQGVLHRDLKPANILLDREGRLHVTDFGLAKRLDAADTALTRDGDLLGTPSYMSPEQASGKAGTLGPACDVYGLGAVLYELLTGRPPFRSESVVETIRHVRESEPVPPRLLNRNIEPDLETICLKCLEKEPERRYASASELAADLGRYLNREPISARSYNLLARLARGLNKPSYRPADLRSWAGLLLLLGAIILASQILTYFLVQSGLPSELIWLKRVVSLLAAGAALWWFYRRAPRQGTAAERQAYTIWVGALAAYGVTGLVSRFLFARMVLCPGPEAPGYLEELIGYPYAAIVSGLAFFVMGGGYGGRFYAVSLGFFALAMMLPLCLNLAAPAYGLFWAFCLAGLALQLRRSVAEHEEGPVEKS